MPAYRFPTSRTSAERVLANARRLIRAYGPQAEDIADRRADEARDRGDTAGLRLWRRTARNAAHLLARHR